MENAGNLRDRPAHNGARSRGICAISGAELSRSELVPIETLRPALANRIRAEHPHLTEHSLISLFELAVYRTRYVEELLREERGEYSDLDRQVVQSIARQETIAANIEKDFHGNWTLGERLSDRLASFGGSWTFLICFGGILVVWIAVNVVAASRAFDPYPFILLNLILSCLAAIQAPIIMMSQRRQEEKDRLRSLNDYRVNLKAELEVRHLHEKIDHLVTRQWQRLVEIQQIQLDMMEEVRAGAWAPQKAEPARTKAGKRRAAGKPDPDAGTPA